ncbi:hypothetical protein BD410DRAFT_710196 [Rickenella mellea]|uniref:N-acetyltransferase domain-containing protein n=1 Tax=Rickenella mellea TaxID=50990 RepID=A0A4R5XFR9_9AGAM|nr:hypothetical protein BD410DRAFT_710196 [Rickenella mellea]
MRSKEVGISSCILPDSQFTFWRNCLDKFTEYIVGGFIGNDGNKSLVPDVHRAQIKAGLIGGRVYVAEIDQVGIVGAAVWFGPGEELLSSPDQAAAGFNQFMGDLGSRDPEMPAWWMTSFLPNYGKFTSEALGDPKYKHNGWHLQLLGVEPKYQRHGVGTALIKYVKDIDATSESKHLSVETETEGARQFYKQVGFIERGETTVESEKKLGGSCPMWCLSYDL